ncbi:MAG: hypothetical protein H7252_08870 [Cytophaga sp.]|nr:hypothetical protein [Undibacterium sp.]
MPETTLLAPGNWGEAMLAHQAQSTKLTCCITPQFGIQFVEVTPAYNRRLFGAAPTTSFSLGMILLLRCRQNPKEMNMFIVAKFNQLIAMKSKRLKLVCVLVFAATTGLSLLSFAQQRVSVDPYMAVIRTDPRNIAVGTAVTLDILVMDATSMAPSEGLSITTSLSTPAMDAMALEVPKVTTGLKPGEYKVRITLPHAEEYKLDLNVKNAAGKSTILSFKIIPASGGGEDGKNGGQEVSGMKMKANFGNWSASREGSGTSWQSDSSPMFMKMLPSFGGFEFGTMGTIQAGYVDAGGNRGDKGRFSQSMIMLMGSRDLDGGTLGLHIMTSADTLINGKEGVPNLFQNGFTSNGIDISDRKDPHNVFAELAVSYSHSLSKNWTGFLYGGPVGEPALGNGMYLHRTSGLEIPEAPISHDWFDGSHISFGVATLGLVYQNKWKLEASVFNSAEPGNNLYGMGPLALNSASVRLSYNPSPDLSFSTSYGHLKSDAQTHRLTFSAAYSHKLAQGDNFSATAYFGRNVVQGSANSDALLTEAAYYRAKNAFFFRFERVDKGELLDVPSGNYTINKLVFGGVHNFYRKDRIDYGLGTYAGAYSFPSSLNASYGSKPLTFGVFLRIRPSESP